MQGCAGHADLGSITHASCVILDKLLPVSEVLLHHMESRNNDSMDFKRGWRELQYFFKCLEHICVINKLYYCYLVPHDRNKRNIEYSRTFLGNWVTFEMTRPLLGRKGLAMSCSSFLSFPKWRKSIIHYSHPVTVPEKDRASRIWKTRGRPSVTPQSISIP